MKWFERTEEQEKESIKNFREHYTKEELEKFKEMFEKTVEASKIYGSKNLDYWEYELKFVNKCLEGEN